MKKIKNKSSLNKKINLEKKHKKSLEKIAKNPASIGITGRFSLSEIEVPIFNSYEKVGEIDIFVFDCVNGINYYIEYKCNDSKSMRKKAKKQILLAKEFADEKYRGNPQRLLYVSGEFNTKELMGEKWVDFSETPYK
jgi:hypothetical protein